MFRARVVFTRCRTAGLHIALLAAVVAAPVGLEAQEQSSPPDEAIDSITVTARRREEPLQTVPVAVTAFDEETLVSASVATLVDLGALTPGLYLEGTGSAGGGAVSMRSQVAPEVQLNLDPAVGVYIDDVYLPRQRGNLGKLFDVSSVQALKGPQGTAFGRNTTGGALVIQHRKPSGGLGGYVQATIGDYDRIDTQGALEFPIIEDTLAARLAFDITRRNEGYTRNLFTGQELDDDHSESWRATLVWTPTEDIEMVLRHDGLHIDQAGGSTRAGSVIPGGPTVIGNPLLCFILFSVQSPLGGGLGDCIVGGALAQEERDQEARGPYEVNSDLTLFQKTTTWGLSHETRIAFDGFEVKNVAAYRRLSQESNIDVDGSQFRLLGASLAIEQWQFSEELLFSGGSDDGALEWFAGVYYFEEQGTDGSSNASFEDVFLLPAFAANDPNPNAFKSSAENSHYSAFGELAFELPFLEDVRARLGARYNYDERKFTAEHFNGMGCTLTDAEPPAGVPLDPCIREVDESFDKVTWTAGLDWQVTEDVMLYVVQRRGYRSGGFNLRALSPSQFQPFKAEIVTDYEIGLKSEWELFGRPGRLNLAAYTQDYKNIQRTILTIVGTTFITDVRNAASAEIEGGELELWYRPADGLSLRFGFAASIARYDEFIVPDPQNAAANLDRSNDKFTSAPDYMANGTVRYETPMIAMAGRDVGSLAFQVDGSWVSDIQLSFNQGPGNQTQGDYALVNARIELQDFLGSNLDLAVFGRNLFDTEYKTGAVNAADTVGFGFLSFGSPRIWGVELRFTFGSDAE